MTRMLFLSFATAALFATACERHPASELSEEGSHAAAPKAPTQVATNPGGAAPVLRTNDKGQPPATPAGSPSFFPAAK